MIVSKFRRAPVAVGLAAVAALAMLTTPMLSSAKPEAPAAPPIADEQPPAGDLQKLQLEFLTIREALAEAEQQALKDPGLQQAHAQLQSQIERAMRAADPKHDSRMARLREIEQEVQSEQVAGQQDLAKLQPLLTEAQGIQERLVAIQLQVVETEPLKSEIAKMRERMVTNMSTVNPEVPELLARLEVLAKRFEAQQ